MIYTYDDIVKKTEETICFRNIDSSDIGKIITIHLEKEDCGGRIIDITDAGIVFYKEHVTLNLKRVNKRSFVSIKTLAENPNNKICIYEPINGTYIVYVINECIYRAPKTVEFNTDILKPGSRFFLTENNKCGIVEVESVCGTTVSFKEVDTLYGGSGIIYNINSETLKDITLKPIGELTNCDLLLRGFNSYKLCPSLFIKIQTLLEDTKAIPNKYFEKE